MIDIGGIIKFKDIIFYEVWWCEIFVVLGVFICVFPVSFGSISFYFLDMVYRLYVGLLVIACPYGLVMIGNTTDLVGLYLGRIMILLRIYLQGFSYLWYNLNGSERSSGSGHYWRQWSILALVLLLQKSLHLVSLNQRADQVRMGGNKTLTLAQERMSALHKEVR